MVLRKAFFSSILLTLVSVFVKDTTAECSGTYSPNPDFTANWTVEGSVVNFVVTSSALCGVGQTWVALGFSEDNSSPFMVIYSMTISKIIHSMSYSL